MALVSRNTVDDMIQFLKKEMIRSQVNHGASWFALFCRKLTPGWRP